MCDYMHTNLPELLKTWNIFRRNQNFWKCNCSIQWRADVKSCVSLRIKCLILGYGSIGRGSYAKDGFTVCSGTDIYRVVGSFFSFLSMFPQAPAVDVIAVGLVSGHIIIHNIKFDETLMKFQQDWGPITAISFRTGRSF